MSKVMSPALVCVSNNCAVKIVMCNMADMYDTLKSNQTSIYVTHFIHKFKTEKELHRNKRD